ncbi:type IV pilus twitching motility protein PilT [Candidatus Peregrinibacteria bacterium]|nr:type IV pilus twitching motility protein PilT [Candidatus Peregrinibacteria bacterium]
MDFQSLIKEVVATESPDLHLHVGQRPMMRLKNGSLSAMGSEALSEEALQKIIETITTKAQQDKLKENAEIDFSYAVSGVARFRVNVYREKNGPAMALRVIAGTIPEMANLGLSEVISSFTTLPHGLVLVTGPTGMGKSTTLASMIDHINQTRECHIITIEDPIEYAYESKKALVTQREINSHTSSFPQAVRSALREDPDVVLVGEMRDLETIAATITLAETGHLVFSTLHTSDAPQTVDRIIDVFPAYQQQQIRTQLAGTLKGVISQTLVPRADGKGRVAAREILVVNDAVRNCIMHGETHQIYSLIQLGQADGMMLMDQSLEQLVRAGLITVDEALSKANDLESLRERFKS